MELNDIQKQVLAQVQARHDWVSIADLAANIDVHPNSVRNAVTQLTDANLLERKQAHNGKRGRPTFLFRARDGQYTVLKGVLMAMEGATTDEQDILEGLITGRFEGALEDSENLLPDIVKFLKTVDVTAYEENDEVHVTACPFREMNGGEVGYSCRLHRAIIQQAIGSRGKVLLSPLHSESECRIKIQERVDDPLAV